jgi:hypothetical protein
MSESQPTKPAHAVRCGDCGATGVPLVRGACSSCISEIETRSALREAARPLVLEWLRTRRLVQRKNDLFATGIEPDSDSRRMVFDDERAAEHRLLAFLGGSLVADAFLDVLNEHFATDYSETMEPTLAFTPEFDRVLAAGGKHDFERYMDSVKVSDA